MKVNELILIRHGETPLNKDKILLGKSGIGLSDIGKKQAFYAAKLLMTRKIDIIFSSTERRAIETSEIISKCLGLPFEPKLELRERDYGSFDGLNREDLLKKRIEWGVSSADPTQDWEEISCVESDQKIWERIKPLLAIFKNENKNCIWITHAGVMKSALYYILGISSHRILSFKFPNGVIVTFKNQKNYLELNELIPNPYLFFTG